MFRMADVIEESSAGAGVLSWAAGLGFTFLLFWGLAHLENHHPDRPAPQIPDLRAVTMPLETPPPTPTVPRPQPVENAVALTGIDMGASDSPVHIAVVPPDLQALVPTSRVLPGAVLKSGYLDTQFKPRVKLEVDVNHVYLVSQVDRPPQAIVRVAPAGAAQFFGNERNLRVVLLIVIDTNGRAASTQVVQSSGKPKFDELVAKTVRDQWEFSPAIRHGKKVRCMGEQPIRVDMGRGNPFEAQ